MGGADAVSAMARPDIDTIVDAARLIRDVATVTPLLRSDALDERLRASVWIKPECLQRTGSFKFRGAWVNIARLSADQRRRGVVAYSSGNHAQAVAAAAQLHGIPATIAMPEDAPAIKRARTEAWGAAVVPYNRYEVDRIAVAQALATDLGRPLVPPYDHPDTIAGQGTVGLEIASQCRAMGIVPDAVVAPCGGGGLIAGVSTALAAVMPGVPVHPAEPLASDDTKRSLEAGRRIAIDGPVRSICDSLLAHTPGDLTFAINRQTLSPGYALSDDDVLQAMRIAFEDLKLVLEPGGAAALAAVTSGAMPSSGRTIIVIASGGNVDAKTFARALEA